MALKGEGFEPKLVLFIIFSRSKFSSSIFKRTFYLFKFMADENVTFNFWCLGLNEPINHLVNENWGYWE